MKKVFLSLFGLTALLTVCNVQDANATSFLYKRNHITVQIGNIVNHLCPESEEYHCLVTIEFNSQGVPVMTVEGVMIDSTPYDDGSGNAEQMAESVLQDLSTLA